MPKVNSSSISLIWEKSVDVMKLVFIFACRNLAFSRTDLLLRMVSNVVYILKCFSYLLIGVCEINR